MQSPPAMISAAEHSAAACAARIRTAVDGLLSCEESERASQAKGLEYALTIGRELLAARDLLPDGESWDDWRKKNLPHKRSSRQYQKYQRIALEWDRIGPLVEKGDVASIQQAIRFLTEQDTPDHPSEISQPNKPPQKEPLRPGAEGPPEDSTIIAQTSQAEESTQDEGQGGDTSDPPPSFPTVRPLSAVEPVDRIERVQSAQSPQIAQSDRVDELMAKVRELEKEIARKDAVIAEVREANLVIRRENDELKTEAMRLKDDLAKANREHKEKVADLNGEINQAIEEGEKTRGENAELRSRVLQLQTDRDAFQAQAMALQRIRTDEIKGKVEPARRVEHGAAEDIAKVYQELVRPGETIGGGLPIIRALLLKYSKEQLLNTVAGYAAFCDLNKKEKRVGVSRFFSDVNGSYTEFLAYIPPEVSTADSPLQTPVVAHAPEPRSKASGKPTRAELIAKYAKDLPSC